MWNKISSSEEVICYEKKNNALSVRLEARSLEDSWEVYRGFYTKEGQIYTEEYSVPTREEAERMIVQLKNEKDLTQSEINDLIKKKNLKLRINVRRSYREDTVEKWFFTVNYDVIENFIVVRDYERLEMDIILHESYKGKEKLILKEISKVLSIESSLDVDYSIYYFSSKVQSNSEPVIVHKYEVEFDFKN